MAETKKPLVFRDRDTKEKIPFYVKTEDVELPDGTDIGTKVAELEEAIGNAGDGTVKTVTLNGTTIEPDANGDVELTLPEVEVDDELDEESGNAVSNAAVTTAIEALRTAIETVIGEDATQAIENFQEVLDFLADVHDDETLIGLLTALQTALAGKQDTLTFDNAPTPDSNNMVKSGGIYNAIANKVSQVVLNNIPADSVAIVDDVVTDDPEQVLSARQGKRLADSIAGLGLEAHEANGTLFISRVADNRSVPPTISYTETSTTITVTAAGVGTITLYRGGTEAANAVSNPITINKTSTASVVRFYATAQQTGKTVSEMASLAVTIPAYVAPNPRLTSPANNSSVNITRTASLVSTALSAQSDSPVTIPAGVASQSVAVTVNAPTEVIDFDNLLTDVSHNDTFPFQMPASNSPWVRWKKAVDNGYSSNSTILVIGKLTSDCPDATLKCYKDSNTSHMIFIEDANGDMVSAGAGVAQATVPSGKWFAGWFYGSASQSTQSIYFLGTATYEYCYAVNFSAEKISGDTIADFVQRYAKLPLTIHNASYSNAGSQDLTVTHNGTDTVISNITTGATITVEAGDTVSISSGSVNFSVDVTTYTAGTATVVVKGADLSQPISIAVSGTGFTCDTVSVTAAEANSTNGKNVVVTYDASGSNTGALTLTSSEFNTVSVTLNGTNA